MSQTTPRQARNYRTQVVAIAGGQDEYAPGTAELGYQFINQLHRPVTVITRLGTRLIIPYKPVGYRPPVQRSGKKVADPLGTEPRFIIRVKVAAHHDVILDTTELSNDFGHTTSREAQAFLDAIQFKEDLLAHRVRTESIAWVEYHIPAGDFDLEGGVLFLQNLDLQVSVLEQASTAPHPYSILGQRNRDAYQFKEDMAPKGVFYGVYIRDRDHQYGNRFININGSVYAVPIIEDEGEEIDGVYRITCGRTLSNFAPKRVLTEYYTFEEADEKLGLYQTYNEANTLGKPEERFKRDYEERIQALRLDELRLKEERTVSEREFEQTRDVYRRAQMQYDHELKRLDQINRLYSAELERREQRHKHEMLVLKEIAEINGHGRRESTELIKLIPTVLTTVATYVAAYKKLKSL